MLWLTFELLLALHFTVLLGALQVSLVPSFFCLSSLLATFLVFQYQLLRIMLLDDLLKSHMGISDVVNVLFLFHTSIVSLHLIFLSLPLGLRMEFKEFLFSFM
jgi:hypothetical protein